MQVEQVDAVAAEALQNFRHLPFDLGRLQAIVMPGVYLGGEVKLAAYCRRQHAPKHFLGTAVAIGVRGIEFIVTGVGESLQQRFRGRLLDLVAEGHGAED